MKGKIVDFCQAASSTFNIYKGRLNKISIIKINILNFISMLK